MSTKMKDSELKALLKSVEAEIGAALASEASRLSKAIGDEPEGDEGSAAPEHSEPDGDEADAVPPPPDSEGSLGGHKESAEESHEESAPGPETSVGPETAEGGEGDPEALKAEYIQLGQENPEALKAHYLACVEALQTIMGGGEQSAPPGAPAGPGPEASAPGPVGPGPGGPPIAQKMELGSIAPTSGGSGKDRLVEVAPKGQIGAGKDRLAEVAVKSEMQAELDTLRKNQDMLVNALDKFLGHPLRKAVVGVGSVTAGGQPAKNFTRDEAKAALNAKLQNGSLKKSDRERVIAFTVGNINVDDIRDLLA